MKIIKQIKKIMDEHYKITAFLISTVIVFIDLCICNVTVTYGDASGYATMAEWFRNNGMLNFNVQPPAESVEAYLFSMRGYAWPLILAACKSLGFGTQIGYYIFYSLFIASGISYAVLEFIEILFGKKINWYLRIIPVIFTIFFWNGLIKYPLSDIPAVVIVAWGLLFILKISYSQKFIINCLYALLSGIFLGVSYYIRSGCKPIWILAVLLILIYKYKKAYVKKFSLILMMCAGIGISMIPQFMINISCSNILSYEVPIFLNSQFAHGEYYLGFKLLRYETNISSNYPQMQMYSWGNTIDNILAAENIAVEDVGILTILKLFLTYPFQFLGMYATKFANYLDPRYANDLYLIDLNSKQYTIMFVNYLLWFVSFMGIAVNINNHVEEGGITQRINAHVFIKKYALWIFSFIIPAIIHLAGTQVEVRYFYPCYVLMYVFLVSLCPWKKIKSILKRKWITIAVICLALFGCLNAIWNFTFENFDYSQLLLDNNFVRTSDEKETILQQDTKTQSINYDIWTLDMNEKNYLTMTGYIFAVDKNANDSELCLVLVGRDVTYLSDINLTDNIYMDGLYKKSKFSINKDLIELSDGKYEIGFIITNKEDKSVIFTGKYLEVQKE